MTDIIASPAVKEAVKVVMEQQERLGDEAAAEARESQPIRTSVLRAAPYFCICPFLLCRIEPLFLLIRASVFIK